MKNTVKLLVALLVSWMMTACSTPPPVQKPVMDVPAAFKETSLWKIARPDAASVPDDWWQMFNDPVLNDLQQQVVLGNENLKTSAAQVQIARAALGSSRSGLMPTLGASAGGSRGASSGNAPAANSYSVGANASWEVDLWGRVAGSVTGAQAKLQASEADLAAARLSVRATLAQTYFSLRAAELQTALLSRSVAAYQRSMALTQNRYASGVASAADVAQAQTQLKSTQAQQLQANSNRTQLENALATLVGKTASSFTLARGNNLPIPPAIPVLLPANLMERRPDIAAAAARVAAANAQIGVAQSAYFPALTLSGSAGYRGSELGELVSAPNLFWSIGPALALALFDGGVRQSAQDSAQANADQAIATYRQTVLTALQEVEDNLAVASSMQEELVLQGDALKAAERSLEIASNQYTAGTVSYLNVVTAQATVLASERSLLDLRNRQLAATTQLLKNLGGRWGGEKANSAEGKNEPK